MCVVVLRVCVGCLYVLIIHFVYTVGFSLENVHKTWLRGNAQVLNRFFNHFCLRERVKSIPKPQSFNNVENYFESKQCLQGFKFTQIALNTLLSKNH